MHFLNHILNHASQFHQGHLAYEQPINTAKQVPKQGARLQLSILCHVSFLA